MTTGDIYTIAGNGTFGFAGDGGPAASASVSPERVAIDGAGNVLIADPYHYRVRVVAEGTSTFYGQPIAGRTATFYGQSMKAGDIYTVAGDGTTGFAGDGGPATAARLNRPHSTAVDAAGNVLIADTGNSRIRVVAHRTGTFYGQFMRTGHIYTIAGGGSSLGDGGPATAAELSAPGCVAVEGAGNVLIADTGNNRVRVAAASSGTFYGQQMTTGDIYTVAGTGTRGFTGDGGPATSAELCGPAAVAVDAAGNLLVTDSGNNRIREVTG
jgi:hypothetical protein